MTETTPPLVLTKGVVYMHLEKTHSRTTLVPGPCMMTCAPRQPKMWQPVPQRQIWSSWTARKWKIEPPNSMVSPEVTPHVILKRVLILQRWGWGLLFLACVCWAWVLVGFDIGPDNITQVRSNDADCRLCPHWRAPIHWGTPNWGRCKYSRLNILIWLCRPHGKSSPSNLRIWEC